MKQLLLKTSKNVFILYNANWVARRCTGSEYPTREHCSTRAHRAGCVCLACGPHVHIARGLCPLPNTSRDSKFSYSADHGLDNVGLQAIIAA